MSGMNKDDVIVVAGGGGFIGAHLVAELLDAGFQQIRSVDVKTDRRLVSGVSRC